MPNQMKDILALLFPVFVTFITIVIEYQYEYRDKSIKIQQVHDFFGVVSRETTVALDEIENSITSIIEKYDNCSLGDIQRIHSLEYSRSMVTEILVLEEEQVVCGNKDFYFHNIEFKNKSEKFTYLLTEDSLLIYRYSSDRNIYILWTTSFRHIYLYTRTAHNSLVKIEFYLNEKIYLSSIGSDVKETNFNSNNYNTIDYSIGNDGELMIRVYYPHIDITKLSSKGIVYILIILLLSTLFSAIYFVRKRASLENIIRMAFNKGEFVPYFQPIVDLKTGSWVGAEALIRWYKDGTVYKYPDEFIPYAEQDNLSIGFQQVCFNGCIQLVKCIPGIHKNFFVSINISPGDLDSDETQKLFDLKLECKEVSFIELEITERGIDPKKMDEFSLLIKKLHKHGIKISLDDFGTGQSGLSYINSLSFDKIKIDKKFVDAIGTDSVDFHILTTIIGLAKKLDVIIVAEGIETELQREWLLKQEVNIGQGWLFSRELSHADFMECMAINQITSRNVDANDEAAH